jgi:hypothetical protein
MDRQHQRDELANQAATGNEMAAGPAFGELFEGALYCRRVTVLGAESRVAYNRATHSSAKAARKAYLDDIYGDWRAKNGVTLNGGESNSGDWSPRHDHDADVEALPDMLIFRPACVGVAAPRSYGDRRDLTGTR